MYGVESFLKVDFFFFFCDFLLTWTFRVVSGKIMVYNDKNNYYKVNKFD